MANRRKDDLREAIFTLRSEHPEMTLREVAKAVGLRDRQWVYYYLKPSNETTK